MSDKQTAMEEDKMNYLRQETMCAARAMGKEGARERKACWEIT